MSKKVLTPEQAEIKAMKKEKASSGWTGFLAVLLAVVLTIGVVMVGKSTAGKVAEAGGNTTVNVQSTDNNDSTIPGGPVDDTLTVPGGPVDDTIDNNATVPGGDENNGSENTDNKPQNSKPQRELPEDPKEWTKDEVVNFYKASAQKSTSAKSVQKMTMDNGMDVTLNNSLLEFAIGLAEPIIKAALKANSTEFDGITGGYNSLVPSDVKTAKAYKDGKYTVIEMTMVEQTDDAYGDTFKGTVGHAISVVGNIAVVTDQFPDWKITFDTAYVALHYDNPTVKVRINENGVIEKGTWSYVVNVHVKDLWIENVQVVEAKTDINYVITTGGGF